MVKMRGVDLAQFQFDYDLKWAAVLLNADGTVYARYGSGSADGDMALQSVAGLRRTLDRVLEAHAAYPENRARFIGKRGPAPPYRRAEEIPSPKIRKLLAGDARQSCVHCHNVYDGRHDLLADREDYDPRKLFKYPLPENVGLVVDAIDGTAIQEVRSGSPAAVAGVRPGDRLESIGGQAILSLADIQFALHFLGEKATVDISVLREVDGKTTKHSATLRLEAGWRESDISWRASMWNLPPGPGFWTEALDTSAKSRLGIAADRAALLVRGVWHPVPKRAGIAKGDIIVAIGGRTDAVSAPAFAAFIRLHCYRPGSRLELAFLRDGERQVRTLVYP